MHSTAVTPTTPVFELYLVRVDRNEHIAITQDNTSQDWTYLPFHSDHVTMLTQSFHFMMTHFLILMTVCCGGDNTNFLPL